MAIRSYRPSTSTAAYGGIPNLPTSGQLSGNVLNILNQAIPGYSGLTQTASGIIEDSMAGRVPADVQRLIRDRAATQAVGSGMPGAGGGSLHGNLELRDLGLTSLGQRQQGFQDLLAMLQGVSGTAAPTFGQAQEQENARATYAAAPDPAAAAAEQQRLFDKYSTPAGGTGASSVPPNPFINTLFGRKRYSGVTGSYSGGGLIPMA